MRLAALALAALAGCAPAGEPRGGGIVSTNPCTDAILAELVPPGRIAAISHYSRDPDASSMDVALARRLPAMAGTAEEVIALRPEMVLLGDHTPLATKGALERAGVPALYVGVPSSIEDSRAEIRRIAHAVGAPAKGEALVTRIDAAVARAAGHQPVPALIWQAGGLVPGEGTLADSMLRAAGFANASSAYGLASWDMLPLERLAMSPPHVVLAPGSDEANGASARERLLARWGGRVVRAEFDRTLLFCGGPTIPKALERLGEVRNLVDRQPPFSSRKVEKRSPALTTPFLDFARNKRSGGRAEL